MKLVEIILKDGSTHFEGERFRTILVTEQEASYRLIIGSSYTHTHRDGTMIWYTVIGVGRVLEVTED